ncbi:MAG: LuxR C-terminal-related transcriptional regulator, partial [Mariprofundaceae bacterium]|nr:LuxR C-terminal-related transcriptional regulator [Mariprofundaceae bacterium]
MRSITIPLPFRRIYGLENTLGGGSYVPREAFEDAVGNQSPDKNKLPSLTERQIEVLKLVRKGMSNDAIAEALDISLTTVKSHVHGVFD